MLERANPARPGERHYGLDWLRIGAFGLLILYHIGMFFSPFHWVVKSADPVAWVDWPLAAMRPWRLPLLFLVSGYASRTLLAKLGDPAAFARSRSLRLLLPLAFGTAVIVAPQGWVRLAEQGYTGSFWHFWTHDWFRFRTVQGVPLPGTEHLWFLTYLWVYSMAIAAALLLLPAAWREKLAKAFEALGTGYRVLLLPLAALLILRLGFLFVVPEAGSVLTDVHGHIGYVPPFLLGFGLAAAPGLWSAVHRCRLPALLVSGAALAAVLWAEATYPGDTVAPHGAQVAIRIATTAMGWAAPLVLAGLAHLYLRKDHRWRAPLSRAVFPFYIAHQTIIILAGWSVRSLGLGAPAEFAIILAATLAGCFAFYQAGRRIPWLGPLVGLAAKEPKRSRAAVAAATA